MEQREITINGKTYPVSFDMDTIINYEEVTGGQSFFGEEFKTIKTRIAVVFAAVVSANKDTTLTIEEMMGKKDLKAIQEINAAWVTVFDMAQTFFKIPEVEQKAESDQQTDEKPKKAQPAKN